MSYLVLARKYRPNNFDSVSGQEHVTRTLTNAIKRNKIGHAYLFAGPRGVGKTSIARIFAKALNCEKGPTAEPCLKCTNCTEITNGKSLAVREIDGASHNSVENVRDLIESFRSAPAPGSRYKIYIIDEVHMLSTAAFNALLKSLEEPPPYTVFILATTEAHKIPETVISRCQRYDLRSLSAAEISARLNQIAKDEKLKIDPEALQMLSRLAEGSMRDAQSLLDRVQAYCDGPITSADTSQVLGSVQRNMLFRISESVLRRDAGGCLEALDRTFEVGIDASLLIKDFAGHWRELLLGKFGGENALVRLGALPDDRVELLRQAAMVGNVDLQDLVHLALIGADSALRSIYPRYALEALVVRLATREQVQDLGTIISGIRNQSSLIEQNQRSTVTTSNGPQVAKKVVSLDNVIVDNPVPEPAKSSNKTSPTSTVGQLDWTKFVREFGQSAGPMLLEHLKRLSIETFVPGQLNARGPDFTAKYVKEAVVQKKLEALLQEFAPAKSWIIRVEKSQNGTQARSGPGAISENIAEPGSILEVEQEQQHKSRQKKEKDLAAHPTVQSLQKFFPGTTIESIKLKE